MPISADTGRVYNVQYRPCILNTSEIASIACLNNFSGPALLSCSNLSASRQSTVDSLSFWEVQIASNCKQVRKPRHNSRTKLRIQISHIHNRDNIEFYLYCKFQSLIFSVRRRNRVTDRLNEWQTTRLQYASWLRPPRHNREIKLHVQSVNV